MGSDVLRAYAHTAVAFADAYAGRVPGALERAAHAVALFDAVGCRGWASWPLTALGFAHLSVNDARAAASVLRPAVNALPAAGIQEPAVFPFVPDAIQALITVGDLATAEPVLDWLERRGRELDRPWALATAGRCRALFRAARGDLAGALETIGTALDHHARLPHPVERARTLLVLGQLRRRANQRRRAGETLERARSVFDEVGAAGWAHRAGEELARLGLRRPAGAGLAPRERQVAEHAAGGATGQQASQSAGRAASQQASQNYQRQVHHASRLNQQRYAPAPRGRRRGPFGRLVALVFTLLTLAVAAAIVLLILSQAAPGVFDSIVN